MTGLHSGDGVSVDVLVGLDGSSLGSSEGSSGGMVSSDTGGVLGLGASSGGGSSLHGSNGSVVSGNGSLVVSDGSGVNLVGEVKTSLGMGEVSSGPMVHSSGVSGMSLSVVEFVLVGLDLSVPDLVLGVPVVHDSVEFLDHSGGRVSGSASSSAGSTSSGVVSLGGSGGLHGSDMGSNRGFEGFGPVHHLSVLAGSPCLALEVHHGVVVSGFHELEVLGHVSLSGLLSGGEVRSVVQETEAGSEEVVGLGKGGDSGEDGDFSEHL